eukprot:TRINITY_DN122503_c0_g1_i1.p1 TRINITY_DN122503_c0_g1~~TRINITY_DN122503_c0_g1_i1.p1  ORF type:complete len:348 (-),score=32.46 TRINITY_DN122503_c0_g1_i1:386-1429(-)
MGRRGLGMAFTCAAMLSTLRCAPEREARTLTAFTPVSFVALPRAGSRDKRRWRHRGRRQRGQVARQLFGSSTADLKAKLDTYIDKVTAYSDREIACVPTKWRTLLKGIRAGLALPSLLEAVRLLYVDILPLRIGGDFIMKAISGMVREGNERTDRDISDSDLILASNLFDALDVDGSGTISEENLQAIGLTPAAVDEIMEAIDTDGNHQIDLFEFMADKQGDHEPDVFDVLGHHLESAEVVDHLSRQDIQDIVSKSRAQLELSGRYSVVSKHETRFNDILLFIRELEPTFADRPIANQRLRTILIGSFEAAKDPEVVTALRFVYTEIGAFRVAGDLIFGIVKQFVSS